GGSTDCEGTRLETNGNVFVCLRHRMYLVPITEFPLALEDGDNHAAAEIHLGLRHRDRDLIGFLSPGIESEPDGIPGFGLLNTMVGRLGILALPAIQGEKGLDRLLLLFALGRR